MERLLKRLANDRNYRYKMINEPDKTLTRLHLTRSQRFVVRERVRLTILIVTSLALQIMQKHKLTRQILLDPLKREHLFFNSDSPVRNLIPKRDLPFVDKAIDVLDDISSIIFNIDPFFDIAVGASKIPGGYQNDPFSENKRCSNDGVVCHNNRCTNRDGCDNGANKCNNTRCKNEDCGNNGCTNPKCDNTAVVDCSNINECDNDFDPGTYFKPDFLFEELSDCLENVLDTGIELEFLVQVGRSIKANTFLDPEALQNELADLGKGKVN